MIRMQWDWINWDLMSELINIATERDSMTSAMPWGLLWYDGNPERSLEDKVRRAAARYTEKHGAIPDTCFVHPSEVDGRVMVDECRVLGHQSVLKNHWWIGETE